MWHSSKVVAVRPHHLEPDPGDCGQHHRRLRVWGRDAQDVCRVTACDSCMGSRCSPGRSSLEMAKWCWSAFSCGYTLGSCRKTRTQQPKEREMESCKRPASRLEAGFRVERYDGVGGGLLFAVSHPVSPICPCALFWNGEMCSYA